MKILIACEFSGIVREAFRLRGHDAWSLDILPSEISGQHIQEKLYTDKVNYLKAGWDMVIAHPPCTHLAVSGARWFAGKEKERWDAIKFFMEIALCDVPKLAIENPIGIMSTVYKKPDQIVQPWQFGHGETKATCLWLKGLPELKETNNVKEEMLKLPKAQQQRIHYLSPGPNRGRERSRTYQGIANAMSEQWG
uniref:Putative methyltransferase n=1 Tax=viral metagenome TaxID=1070528 RepID=A0A6M3KBC4_9ZZZZ